MDPAPNPPAQPAVGPWAGRAAFAFVLATLAALVGVPILVQQRVDALRESIEASEPARTVVTRLQFNLVREMASLSELLLGGDTEYSGTYAEARAAERALFAELATFAARLGPDVQVRLAEARALADRWHARVAVEEILRRRAEGTGSAELPREQELFEEVLRATAAVDSTILSATARNREQIRAAERTGIVLAFGLGLLALLAAGTVATLTRRMRRYAAESERRRREAEQALAELALAVEARTHLLRGITHDVKNPLGAAKGYAELLELGVRAPMLPEQAPLVEGLKRSVDGALAIITDLLDVARADSGALAINPVRADLAGVAEEAVEGHRAAAEAAGHSLRFEASPGPLTVVTDPARVAQVLGNLLSNAIKYTPPPGRITVWTGPAGADGAPRDGSWAAVRVSDTGPGIPRDQREGIFNEFTRLHENGGQSGHGLGLAIARRIARLLGGDVTVDDAAGGGAAFVLWLPRRGEAALPPAGSLAGRGGE